MKVKTRNELAILVVFPAIIIGVMIFFANNLDIIEWLKNPSMMWRVFLVIAIFSRFDLRRPLFASILMGLNSTSVIFAVSFYALIPFVGGYWAVTFLLTWILISLLSFWIKTTKECQERLNDEKSEKIIDCREMILEICFVLAVFLGMMMTFARALSSPPFF